MKQKVGMPVVVTIIVLLVALVGYFIYQGTGPRTDGPSQPVDMGKMMGGDKSKMAPPNKGMPGMGGPGRGGPGMGAPGSGGPGR